MGIQTNCFPSLQALLRVGLGMVVVAAVQALLTSSEALAQVSAPPSALSLQGRILDTQNPASPVPVQDEHVEFQVQILSPDHCSLYKELIGPIDMRGTDGVFALQVGPIGSGDSHFSSLAEALLSSSPGLISGLLCKDSLGEWVNGSYDPSPGDSRRALISFKIGSTGEWIELEGTQQIIQSAPYALHAATLQGLGPEDFVRLPTGVSASETASRVNRILGSDLDGGKLGYDNLRSLLQGAPYATAPSGGVFDPGASINMNNQPLYGLPAPVNADQAVNKGYADAYIGGAPISSNLGEFDLADANTNGKVITWNHSAGRWVLTDVSVDTANFLLLDGSRPMVGDLDLNAKAILNVARIDVGQVNATEVLINSHPALSSNLASGRIYVGDAGGVAQARLLNVTDLRSSVTPATSQFPTGCTAGQTMLWSAPNDIFECEDIAITSARVTDFNAAVDARLGTMATKTATDYLRKDENLSGLADRAVARGNLDITATGDGLVTAADAPAARSALGITATGNAVATAADAAAARSAIGAVDSALPSAQIYVGDGGGVAQARSLSGDATLSNAGVLTIGAGAISEAKLADNAVTTIKIADSAVTDAKIEAVSGAKVVGDILGNAIGFSGPLGGDVIGHQNSTMVTAIQGHIVSSTPPNLVGEVLTWTGSEWKPIKPVGEVYFFAHTSNAFIGSTPGTYQYSTILHDQGGGIYTGGSYSVPRPGLCSVSYGVRTQGVSLTGAQSLRSWVQVSNHGALSFGECWSFGGSVTRPHSCSGSFDIAVTAGATIQVVSASDIGVNGFGNSGNFLSIRCR